MEIGLGKKSAGRWRSRDNLKNAIDDASDPKSESAILNNEEKFTAESVYNAAQGKHHPDRKIDVFIKFFTRGENELWTGFLERAFAYSDSFSKEARPKCDEDRVKFLVTQAKGSPPRAITFDQSEGLIDYLSIGVRSSEAITRRLVLDKPSSIKYLEAGLYFPREHVTRTAGAELEKFLLANTAASLPTIFWLDGRSGDGKSTALLQIPELLKSNLGHSFIYVADKRSFEKIDINDARFLNKRIVFVLDDFAKYVFGENNTEDIAGKQLGSFELAIATGFVKSVTIFTCGPSPEMEFFGNEFPKIELRAFKLPTLSREEIRDFSLWFSLEMISDEEDETDLLVEYLFTLNVGMTLRSFAGSFRSRISDVFGLFSEVKKVLTASSFEMAAPTAIFPGKKIPPGIQRLTAEDQRHFHYDSVTNPTKVYFSHNAICKAILRYWMSDPSQAGKEQQLATAISTLLLHCDDEIFAFKFSERLRLHPRHAQDICGNEALFPKELLNLVRGRLPISAPVWTTVTAAIATVISKDRNTQNARAFLESISLEDVYSEKFSSTSSILLMKIAELAVYSGEEQYLDLRDRCVDELISGSLSPHAGRAVGHLVTRKIVPPQVVTKWLALNPDKPRPPELITSAPRSDLTVREASDWLKQHGDTQPAVNVAAWLVRGSLSAHEAISLIGSWLSENAGLNGQYGILASLLKRFPIDDELLAFTRSWFVKNKLMPGAEGVLAQLIRKVP